MKPLIELKNLSVIYNPGQSNEFRALNSVEADIYPEEYIIFFGPSGSGKSTLLYVIAGLLRPTQGSVRVAGQDLTKLDEAGMIEFHRRFTGMVFQAYYLVPSLTVEDNIILPQIFLGSGNRRSRREKARVLMKRFGIESLARKYPNELSGGQQQRTAICRALINNPKIILADEPVGNLDSENAAIFLDHLEELNSRDKKTIIHVTHNPRDLDRAHRIFYIKDGEITRVVRNPRRTHPAISIQAGLSAMEQLAFHYPHLSDNQIKAKLIYNFLGVNYAPETQAKIESLIGQFLDEKLTVQELREILDLPLEKGGVNLYRQSAQTLAKRIAEIGAMMKKISLRLPVVQEEEAREVAKLLQEFLEANYQGRLSSTQKQRLANILRDRVLGRLDKHGFRMRLDAPLGQGGVGLNRRTVKNFDWAVELFLEGYF